MRLAKRTRTVLDMPLSRREFWLFVTCCMVGSVAFVVVLRAVLTFAVRIGGWL